MRRVVLQQPASLRLDEVPEPQPGTGQALVQVRRIGICGTDLHAFRGRQPYFSYPRVLGHELAVEILAVDDNPAGLQPGDRCAVLPYLACGVCIACRHGKTNCCAQLQVLGVHVDGGMQERLALPVASLLPCQGLSLDQIALVENQGIGAHAVRRADLRRGEYVLVVGAGPIGMGIMQFARAGGAQVIALDVDPGRLAFCRQWLQIEHTVDGRQDPHGQLQALTGGEYPTAVFDATGSPAAMMQGFNYVAHGGRYVLVSIVQADISFSDPEFHKRELTLLASRNATRADFEHVIRCAESGALVTTPLITHRAPLEQLIEAFEGWLRPESGVIKALVEA